MSKVKLCHYCEKQIGELEEHYTVFLKMRKITGNLPVGVCCEACGDKQSCLVTEQKEKPVGLRKYAVSESGVVEAI